MRNLMVISFIILPLIVKAQTLNEWIRQKSTQRKYLIQQIAQLEAHYQQLKKGYTIAKSGYKTAQAITKGEYSLHEIFFTGLKNPNPEVRKYATADKVFEISESINKLLIQCKKLTNTGKLAKSDIIAINYCADNITAELSNNLESFAVLLLSSKLELTDDERLNRIDVITKQIRNASDAAKSLLTQISYRIIDREKEKAQIIMLSNLYGLPKSQRQ